MATRSDRGPDPSDVRTGMRAIWNGTVIAESDDTVVVDGNHYFPRSSVREDLLQDSPTTSFCPWKGRASYRSVVVDGEVGHDAMWFYPHPWPTARKIAGRVAFRKGVTVTE